MSAAAHVQNLTRRERRRAHAERLASACFQVEQYLSTRHTARTTKELIRDLELGSIKHRSLARALRESPHLGRLPSGDIVRWYHINYHVLIQTERARPGSTTP